VGLSAVVGPAAQSLRRRWLKALRLETRVGIVAQTLILALRPLSVGELAGVLDDETLALKSAIAAGCLEGRLVFTDGLVSLPSAEGADR